MAFTQMGKDGVPGTPYTNNTDVYYQDYNRIRLNFDDHESRIGAIETSAGDGLGFMRVAKATFDPSANSGHRSIGAHTLGVTIPDNALIVGGFREVLTTCADGASDNATIAFSIESAGDIVAAIAISNGSNPWDAGKQAIIPKANTPESTAVKLSAARLITATVAVHALTAGKVTIFLFYVQGD